MSGFASVWMLRGVAGLASLWTICGAAAASPDTTHESGRLADILRQLDTIDQLADASAQLPEGSAERYHFDYGHLHGDIDRVRRGLRDYLTPPRAQPRDPVALSGQYQIEVRRP